MLLFDSQEQFHFEGNVTLVCLRARCLIILQAMAYRLVNSFDDHIIQGAIVVDICDLTRVRNEVVNIFLEIMLTRYMYRRIVSSYSAIA